MDWGPGQVRVSDHQFLRVAQNELVLRALAICQPVSVWARRLGVVASDIIVIDEVIDDRLPVRQNLVLQTRRHQDPQGLPDYERQPAASPDSYVLAQ
jgi:hypothetical protein